MKGCLSGVTAIILSAVKGTRDSAPQQPAASAAAPSAPQPQQARPPRSRGTAAFLKNRFRRKKPAAADAGEPLMSVPPAQAPAAGPAAAPAARRGAGAAELRAAPPVAGPSSMPRPPAASHAQASVLDLRGAEPASGSKGAAASSHAAVLVRHSGDAYRVKFNHHGAAPTYHEVLGARVHQFLFPHAYVPDVKFGAHTEALPPVQGKYTQVGIASKMVPGFQDWGVFLVRDKHGACAALEFVPEEDRAAYQQLLDQYREKEQQIEEFRSREDHAAETAKLVAKPKRSYLEAPPEALAALEPLRRLSRQALQLQDRMLELLPPAFHQSLVQALYESEAIGNWDYANHERANVGFVVRDGKLEGATVVDFGLCGHMGFSGKLKKDSTASMAVPARVDDPFISFPARTEARGEYLPGAVLDRPAVSDFTKVSPSAGMIGSLPRSASFGMLQKQVVADEREFGARPAPMLQVARRLAQVSREEIRALVGAVNEECRSSQDPALHAMLAQVADTPERIADSYFERFRAIVERAQLPPSPEKPQPESI